LIERRNLADVSGGDRNGRFDSMSRETAPFGQALLGLILHALTLEQSRDQSLRDSD
jgi:hypothetical protein